MTLDLGLTLSCVLESYWVHMTLRPKYLSRIRIPVLFRFRLEDGTDICISREVLLKSLPDRALFNELQPVTAYERPRSRPVVHQEIVLSDTKPDIE